MSGARYTIEQLLHMRESPLVRKPDHLPSIDQWIESGQSTSTEQQNGGRKPRNQNQRPEDPSPMGNFSSQRPSLLQTRHSSRSAQQADEIVLGPPKTSFASSRNVSKLSEERDQDDSPSANQRSRFFRDRENTKNGSKDWRSSKLQDDEDGQFSSRRERDSNGFGQRLDQRWSRDGDRNDRDRPSQRGGWREREKMRNERQDMAEKDPEWMDEPVEKESKSQQNQMRTQQDFERWKERMKAGNTPAAETKDEAAMPEEVVTPVKTTPAASKPQTPLVAPENAGFDKLFGSWAESKRLESPVDARATKAPLTGPKAKSSRFASMFAPKEEPRPALEGLGSMAAPGPAAQHAANGSAEDKEGFARIMAMLGNTSRSAASPAKEHDALAAMFDKAPASSQSPRPQSGFAADAFAPPPPSQLSRPVSNVASPNPASMRPDHASQLPPQMQSIFLDQPPRTGPTPESRKPASLNKDSEFLLNLIQAKNANRAPPPPRPQNEPDNFQLFLDQPPKMHTPAPKPHAPRPADMDEQLFRQPQQPPNMDHSRPRAPPGFMEDRSILTQQAQRSYPNEPPQPRRQSTAQHMPAEMPINRMPNPGPGAPQDFPPNFPFMAGPPPPGAADRMPPPPGFNPNIRHPPGFANIPNIFQQPTAQPPQQGPAMQALPPGFPPGMPPPGIGMQGPPLPPGFFGGPNHAPGVPPGFAPPGMMMMMGGGIRSPEGTPGMRSPQEGPNMGMPMLQGMGAGFGRR